MKKKRTIVQSKDKYQVWKYHHSFFLYGVFKTINHEAKLVQLIVPNRCFKCLKSGHESIPCLVTTHCRKINWNNRHSNLMNIAKPKDAPSVVNIRSVNTRHPFTYIELVRLFELLDSEKCKYFFI